jgi:hypothetical protein
LSAPHTSTLREVQSALESLYALERAPDVVEFVRQGGAGMRETLLVRQHGDELEIALLLPELGDPASLAAHTPSDAWLQLVEGVSHFVYVAERARTELPATKLELELQAEVDKFVLLAFARKPLPPDRTLALHDHLYERVRYLHSAESEDGARYRLANGLAARFVARLVSRGKPHDWVATLRRFYRAGQTEKIHLARAA